MKYCAQRQVTGQSEFQSLFLRILPERHRNNPVYLVLVIFRPKNMHIVKFRGRIKDFPKFDLTLWPCKRQHCERHQATSFERNKSPL